MIFERALAAGKASMPLPLVVGVPRGSILGPLFFSVYIIDLPLSIQNSETVMYANDTNMWSSGSTCEIIHQYYYKKVYIMQIAVSALTG